MTPQFELQIIKPEDRRDVVNFVRKHFMRDEPINRAINLITDEKPINEDLENYLLKDFASGFGLKAVQNGNIVAVSIGSILKRDEREDEDDENLQSSNQDFHTIVNFLKYIDRHSNSFDWFPGSRTAITVGILAVHPCCRGMGMAGRLLNKTWELGKEAGCDFMTVECSSYFTARALEKLGFEQIYRLDYKDYKVDGEIVFKTEPPHVASTVYVKKVQ
ncbi:unnamed protein product [Phyllotreta striolata]|uniref:aralkylamine N-acetyltransferase n=1 Tax=Phyllotreta striolata TaxID=444603 RepID=A0A9N9TPK7_PHYSR|nr:unnamed protein product [Phyllotreta striolata]